MVSPMNFTCMFHGNDAASTKSVPRGKLLAAMKSERERVNETRRTVAACVDASHSPIRKVFHGVSRFMSAT